jgi:hypothetical protein
MRAVAIAVFAHGMLMTDKQTAEPTKEHLMKRSSRTFMNHKHTFYQVFKRRELL